MFETFNSANIANYPIAAIEKVSGSVHTGYYCADFPTYVIQAGKYNFVLYQQQGSVPNLAVDNAVDRGFIVWDGYTEAFAVASGPTNSSPSAWTPIVEPVS